MADVSRASNFVLSQLLWVWNGAEVIIVGNGPEDGQLIVRWKPGKGGSALVRSEELREVEDCVGAEKMPPDVATAILYEAGMLL
jgi:hypothetical protein